MPTDSRRLVYSTDSEPDKESAPQPLPANPAAPMPMRQKDQPVIVGIERKGRGGKTVSILTGVMNPPHGKEALVKLLKSKLGTGGTVKGEEIEIQGDHRDKIVEILRELGYKAKKSGG